MLRMTKGIPLVLAITIAPDRLTPYVMIDGNGIVRDSKYPSSVPGNGSESLWLGTYYRK